MLEMCVIVEAVVCSNRGIYIVDTVQSHKALIIEGQPLVVTVTVLTLPQMLQ